MERMSTAIHTYAELKVNNARERTHTHSLVSLVTSFIFICSSVCVAAGRFHYRIDIDKFHSDLSHDRVVSVCAQQCDIA